MFKISAIFYSLSFAHFESITTLSAERELVSLEILLLSQLLGLVYFENYHKINNFEFVGILTV